MYESKTQFDEVEIYSESAGHQARCQMREHRGRDPLAQVQRGNAHKWPPSTQWRQRYTTPTPRKVRCVKLRADGNCRDGHLQNGRGTWDSMSKHILPEQKGRGKAMGEGIEWPHRASIC